MNYPDTQFVRALGILLILNSHLDQYYPIPYIGTGGAIGNSIFFFLSAFGIYLSQQTKRRPFSEWIAGRIRRIYPSLWIVLIFLLMPLMITTGKLDVNNLTSFIGNFFNPPYWFLQTLLVYYLLSYYLLKDNQANKVILLLGTLGVIYFVTYFTCVDLTKWSVESEPFDHIHYFIVFLFGIFIAQRSKEVSYTGAYNYLVLILLLVLVYVHKYLMTKGLYSEFQFLQQTAMYPIVYYLLKIGRSPIILTKLMQSNTLSAIVNFLSNHTLEIYMIHETISKPILRLQMPFPLNIFIFIMLTFVLSAIVNKLADIMRQKIS